MNKTGNDAMPCHTHYVTFIPFCVLCDIFIQHCACYLTMIPKCVLYIIFIPGSGFYVLLSFHTTRCVTFVPQHVLRNTFLSALCVVSILFVPCSVCYVVPVFQGLKVTHRTNIHTILCAMCATSTPYYMSRVLF
jgi:hypothetical protein